MILNHLINTLFYERGAVIRQFLPGKDKLFPEITAARLPVIPQLLIGMQESLHQFRLQVDFILVGGHAFQKGVGTANLNIAVQLPHVPGAGVLQQNIDGLRGNNQRALELGRLLRKKIAHNRIALF